MFGKFMDSTHQTNILCVKLVPVDGEAVLKPVILDGFFKKFLEEIEIVPEDILAEAFDGIVMHEPMSADQFVLKIISLLVPPIQEQERIHEQEVSERALGLKALFGARKVIL